MYASSACESVEKDLNSYTEMLEPPPPQHTHSIWNIYLLLLIIYTCRLQPLTTSISRHARIQNFFRVILFAGKWGGGNPDAFFLVVLLWELNVWIFRRWVGTCGPSLPFHPRIKVKNPYPQSTFKSPQDNTYNYTSQSETILLELLSQNYPNSQNQHTL